MQSEKQQKNWIYLLIHLETEKVEFNYTSTLFTEPNQAPISIITFADNPSEVHVVSNAGLFIYDDATIDSNSDAIVICGSREMEDETMTREETIISREGKLSRTII